IDHALREGEQRLARAGDRDHLGGGVDLRQAVAALEPARDRRPQRIAAERGRVARQAAEVVGQGLADEAGGRVLRLADRQADRLEIGRRLDAGEQRAQLLEGIGLEASEVWIHFDPECLCARAPAAKWGRAKMLPCAAFAAPEPATCRAPASRCASRSVSRSVSAFRSGFPPASDVRLSKLKLAGFKTFVDPTTVLTPGNLVGVVGPNGCGKSNIIDAVRWVLGETRASALRGESMQDVIFNGSTTRKPVSRASVELVFD